jgi:hypothetical protein
MAAGADAFREISMSKMNRAAAAALLLVGLHAQAQLDLPPTPPSPPATTELNVIATALDVGTDTYKDVGGGYQTITGPFSTNGVLSVQQGAASSSVLANADPVRGMLKSLASAQVANSSSPDHASATAGLFMRDTLRFSGSTPTVDVSFSLAWDTTLSGMDAAVQRPVDGSYWYKQATSSTLVGLSWLTPNPDWTPDTVCLPGSEWCMPQFNYRSAQDGFELVSTFGWDYGGGAARYGARDGRYTDSLTFTVTLPVDTDVQLYYEVKTEATCFHIFDCGVTVDASHSNYLSIAAGEGVSFNSVNSYQYLGRDGVPTPVPEPGTWALSLAGVAALLARTRRRR